MPKADISRQRLVKSMAIFCKLIVFEISIPPTIDSLDSLIVDLDADTAGNTTGLLWLICDTIRDTRDCCKGFELFTNLF